MDCEQLLATPPEAIPESCIQDSQQSLFDTLAVQLHTLSRIDEGELSDIGQHHHFTDLPFMQSYLAHRYDFDSVHYLTAGHPAAILWPMLLSSCKSPKARERLLSAFAIGLQYMSDLESTYRATSRDSHWHATTLFGAPAAVVASAYLNEHPAETVSHALTLLGSAPYTPAASFGSIGKPLGVALAASRAALSLRLASAGYGTGGVDLRVPLIALQSVEAPRGASRQHVWAQARYSSYIKKYPCCGYFNPILDAFAGTLEETTTSSPLRGLLSICLKVPMYVLDHDRFAQPRTLEEASFSLEYATKALVAEHTTGVDLWSASDTREAMSRVGTVFHAEPTTTKESYISLAFEDSTKRTIPISFSPSDNNSARNLPDFKFRNAVARLERCRERISQEPVKASVLSDLARSYSRTRALRHLVPQERNYDDK